MKTKKQLIERITTCNGETLVFTVVRNNEKINVKVDYKANEFYEDGKDICKGYCWQKRRERKNGFIRLGR